ncbi:MAG: HAD hydrolase-like protein [Clostridia bacterium]|nr:HAD hydrolase-like protein [Clostridia bacterium]
MDTVIFDFDGVIADNSEGIMNCCVCAAEKMGLTPPPRSEAVKFIGPPLFESFKAYFSLSDGETRRMVAFYRERYPVKGCFELDFYPGVLVMLPLLREMGFKLAIATGKPDAFIKKICSHFELDRHMTAICGVTFDQTDPDKSEIILNALRLCGSSTENAVYVGDRRSDVQSAEKAGLPCVGVTYGFGTPDELEGCVKIADDVYSLEKTLVELGGKKLIPWKA